jgi:hypothetical protein
VTAPAAPGQPSGPPDSQPRVRLLTRPGCHLCDEVRPVVASICAELGVGWTEVDITADAGLLDRYWEQIPVTFVDGAQHDFWHVDATRLRTALA